MFSVSRLCTLKKIHCLNMTTPSKSVTSYTSHDGNDVEEVWHIRGLLARHAQQHAMKSYRDNKVVIMYYDKGTRYRVIGPCLIIFLRDVLRTEQWTNKNGDLHRTSLPSIIKYNSKGIVEKEMWYCNGYNVGFGDGPASVGYYMTGEKYAESWIKHEHERDHDHDHVHIALKCRLNAIDPVRILYHINGHKKEEVWDLNDNKSNKSNKSNESKMCRYGEDGKLNFMAYFKNDVYGRSDACSDGSNGPAIIRYHKNGKISS